MERYAADMTSHPITVYIGSTSRCAIHLSRVPYHNYPFKCLECDMTEKYPFPTFNTQSK